MLEYDPFFRFLFFPLKSVSLLIQAQKSNDFNSFPLLKQRSPDDEMHDLLMCKDIYICKRVRDLILKISKEKRGLTTAVNKNLFAEKYLRGGYVFYGNCIMETDPTGKRTGEKFDSFS